MSSPLKACYRDSNATTYHGDCRELASLLSGTRLHLIVADPCYQQTSYDWDRWAHRCLPVLRPRLSPFGFLWAFGQFGMFFNSGRIQ